MARQDFLDAESIIQRLTQAFKDHDKAIAASAEQVKKYQGEFNKLPSGYIKAQKELLDLSIKQAKSEKELNNSRNAKNRADQQAILLQIKKNQLQKSDIQLTQAQTKEQERLAKAEAKANAELQKAESFYGRVQARIKALTATYNDLALRKQLGQKLNATEEAQLLSMEKRLLKYSSAIDVVNTKVGKYHQRVGNYAAGNVQLTSAIGQFSRELPNAGISFSTFAISLSNQFGQLQDAIANTVAQNKELIAQGQPVKSVGSQILSSIFSLSTAMYLGIALFTAFNEEISDWISGLFRGSKALNVVKESAKQLNDIRVESAKSIIQEKQELQNNLAVARDTNLSYKEREIAAQKILDQYPFWFENLGKEAVMNGDVQKAIEGVNSALLARAKANAAVEKITENQSKIIDFEEEQYAITQKILSAERRLAAARAVSRSASGAERGFEAETNALADIQAYKDDIADIEKEIAALNEINNRLTAHSITQAKEAIGLDYKATEAKKMQLEALKDVQASEYALTQERLEQQRDQAKEMMENESNGYADREAAAVRYGETLLELAQNRREEELRLLKKGTNDEIAELKLRAAEGEISSSNANAVIKSIEQQSAYDRALIWEKYSKEVTEANGEISKSLEGVWKDLDEQEKKLKQLELHNNNLRQAGLLLGNVDGSTTADRFGEIQNQMREIQKMEEDSRVEELRSQRASIDGEIEKLKLDEKSLENNKALNDLLIKQKEIDSQLLDIDLKRKEAVAGVYENMRNATNEYLQGITSGALADAGFSSLTSLFEQTSYEIVNELGEIETKTGSVFDKLFDQAGTMQEKFAIAFNAVTSIAQEAFAFISQSSRASFQMQYEDLEQRQQIAMKYAGESQAAQDQINEQYEERRKEIKRKELKAQKEQAIFNAIINTAQGVTAALAQANIPLSIIIGALGAAQIAFIAGQQIPAYFKGTDNHPGGLMLVNDAAGSNYKEVIQTPDGSIHKPQGRNVLMNAPKGTIVHRNYDEFNQKLNAMLMDSNIAPFAEVLTRNQFGNVNVTSTGSGITKEDLDTVMAKYTNQKSFNVNIDKNGIDAYWKGRDTIERNFRGKITGKGRII